MSIEKILESALNQGISSRIFPGAVMVVFKDHEIVAEVAAGRATYARWAPATKPGSIFDLASLSKPLVTALTTAAMCAMEMISLDDPVSLYFPPANPFFEKVTIRHLLLHSSGLPAYRPFFNLLAAQPDEARRACLIKQILASSAEAAPGKKMVYSDLGFMLLGAIIEKISSLRLDMAWSKMVKEPMEIKELFFAAALEKGCRIATVVPTEYCPIRKRIVWGEVHDLNCWVLGGVAGHAGLFGTARGVAQMLMAILEILKTGGRGDGAIPSKLLRLFLTPVQAQDGSLKALGFDVPAARDSHAGNYFSSEHSVGHLGFTGTSFWLDIKKGVGMVLLTNRTFPSASEETQKALARFRPYIHDLAWNALSC